MQGYDISNYQRGMDIEAVKADFTIIKATEGTYNVQSTCDPWVQTCIKIGRPFGFYHFGSAEDPRAQADFFVKNTRGYFGKGIPVYDYEQYGRIGTDGALVFLDRVRELTGVAPLVYISRSVCTEEDWMKVAEKYGLWVAQYASNKPTGYQEQPWLPGGGFGAFPNAAIHQYTSHGRLSGYAGDLDLNKAHMTKETWAKFAGADTAKEPEQKPDETTPCGSVVELAAAVIRGEFGDDKDRREALGSRFDEVQAEVNHLIMGSAESIAREVIEGKYGAGETRRRLLGSRWREVQDVVNDLLESSAKSYTVQAGDTLWSIANAHGTTVAAIVAKNRQIKNPNVIHVGQKVVL